VRHASKSPIVLVAARTLSPAIQVMAFYVIIHGHYSPGGGFQGGVLLAASFLLLRLALGDRVGRQQVTTGKATLWSAAGTLVFVGLGALALAFGGNFLDYAAIPRLGVTPAEARYFGILIVELAVGVAVAGALVSIYDDLLLGRARDDRSAR
jgi:multicomponent Na+:H+ antiporter subunit B